MLESFTKTPSFRPFKVSIVNMPSPHLFRSKSLLCCFLRLFCIFPYYNIILSIHLVVCLSVYLHSQVHRTLELFNYLSFLNLRAAQGWAPWAADLRIGRNDYHIREKGEIRQGGEGRERTERREGLLLPRTAVILYTEHPAPFCWHILVVTQELAPLKLSWSQPRSHRGVNGWVRLASSVFFLLVMRVNYETMPYRLNTVLRKSFKPLS